jgi:hypothetical protein
MVKINIQGAVVVIHVVLLVLVEVVIDVVSPKIKIVKIRDFLAVFPHSERTARTTYC